MSRDLEESQDTRTLDLLQRQARHAPQEPEVRGRLLRHQYQQN